MKCKECKYYFNGTCATGVFKDLDDDTVIKIELGCKYGSLNKQLKKVNGIDTSGKTALNLDVVSNNEAESEVAVCPACGCEHTENDCDGYCSAWCLQGYP